MPLARAWAAAASTALVCLGRQLSQRGRSVALSAAVCLSVRKELLSEGSQEQLCVGEAIQ